ncbi:MAG: hypothetical protein ACOC9E_06725 [Chloroflexota bacterium]
MIERQERYRIFLEIGKKKVFAGAVDWPGWCRWAKDEEAALQTLLDYGPRYARILEGADVGFEAPEDVSAFNVVERVEGNSTTDFGAPNVALASDEEEVDEEELQRLEQLLKANWAALDEAVEKAQGKELRKGPRGGGRELDGIVNHVLESGRSYLRTLGWNVSWEKGEDDESKMARLRKGVLEGLKEGAAGNLPKEGPRGGKRWPPRQFLRRLAWHELDHVWEIEDRVINDLELDAD